MEVSVLTNIEIFSISLLHFHCFLSFVAATNKINRKWAEFFISVSLGVSSYFRYYFFLSLYNNVLLDLTPFGDLKLFVNTTFKN